MKFFLLFGAVMLGCQRPGVPTKLLGTWLPKDAAKDAYGLILLDDQTGSFTSKQILDNYPRYKAKFIYEVDGDTLRIRRYDEEGELERGFSTKWKLLSSGELQIDDPMSPLIEKLYKRVTTGQNKPL
ncbi:MAG: hypothetical protein EON58_11585 [Alphaproteobacteria bacterium]|nr:MAG: hypothetical protein EON58_11585 [Alphaproteobacteria bacterium]